MTGWDMDVDVPVMGSGAAGLTAALVAADAGLRSVDVMGRTCAGPGSTIAPAVVFGYRAARHAAGRATAAPETGSGDAG